VLGDWREEIIATLPGELRIYTTTIPAEDRRVCLMQDHLYRMDVAIQAMGYTQCPMTSTCFSAEAANLALVIEGGRARAGEEAAAEVVLTAPADRALRGTVRLTAGRAVTLGTDTVQVDVAPGQIGRYPFSLALAAGDALFAAGSGQVSARFEGEGGPLTAALTVEPLDEPMTDRPRTQAEAIAAQGGGEVQLREDKVGADGACFSHWDAPGHWLEWTLTAPQAGRYVLVVRYCAQTDVRRSAAIDGDALGEFSFPATGGFSSERSDWRHELLRDPDGAPLAIELAAGKHTLRLTNADGNGMNVDYLLVLAE